MIFDQEDIIAILDAKGRVVCRGCLQEMDLDDEAPITQDRLITTEENDWIAFCDICNARI